MAVGTYAHVVSGTVVNMILADPSEFTPPEGTLVTPGPGCDIGGTFDGSTFTLPAPPAPSYRTTGLSFLEFMGLFTSAEQTAIVGSTDATVKLFCLMAAGATWIDLTNPEVVAGVGYLGSSGLVTTDRAAVVLTGAPPA